jgi:putative endonuclease
MPRHWSEPLAKSYLEQQGYKTLAENYSIRGAEIDLIMQDAGVIVFVEVRQRKSQSHGSAAESITSSKMSRLRKAALSYLVTTFARDDLPVRFDAVLISGTQEGYRLEHLKNIL